MAVEEAVPAARIRRPRAVLRFGGTVVLILVLLFGLPWWTIVLAGNDWSTPVVVIGSVIFGVALGSFPPLMVLGHGRRHQDWAACIADALLGIAWILFSWSVVGAIVKLVLLLAGVPDPTRSRVVSIAVAVVGLTLIGWGHVEAMRVPRIRRVDVTLPRLGDGLDGLKVVLLTDTHYGPIDRARWSARVVAAVNELDAGRGLPHRRHRRRYRGPAPRSGVVPG